MNFVSIMAGEVPTSRLHIYTYLTTVLVLKEAGR